MNDPQLSEELKDYLRMPPSERAAAIVEYAKESVGEEEWKRIADALEAVHIAVNTGDVKALDKLGVLKPKESKPTNGAPRI